MKDSRTGTIWGNQGGAGIDQTGINPVGPADARPMATDLPADCARGYASVPPQPTAGQRTLVTLFSR